MPKHFMLTRLILPLGAAASISFVLSMCSPEPWRSLLVNLAATFLGSVITVFYVDEVLRCNEEHRWKTVMGHVGRQVNILANQCVSSFRSTLGLPLPPFFDDPDLANSPPRMREAIRQIAEVQVLPRLNEMRDMDQDDWRNLANNMRGVIAICERLLALFGRNLDPVIMTLVLDVHEKAISVLTPYTVFPDMLGVPADELKPNRRGESSAPLLRAFVNGAIRDAEQLLTICIALLSEIGVHFPEKKPVPKG
jgi:hypothetical protein